MEKFSSRKIAITSVFLALLAVFSFTPLGLMPIIPGVIDTAFLLIVLATLAVQLEGLWVGVICTTAFGIFSFINSFIRPSLMAFCFQNPLISIVPRIIMGFTTYFSMRLTQKLTANSGKTFVKKQLPSIVSAVVAVITNTALVLGFIALGYGSTVVEVGGEATTLIQVITGSILVINFPVEIAANLLLVPMLYTVLCKYAKKGV